MGSNQPHLLLVDDDIVAIQILGRILAQYPEQHFATSGDDALEQARACRPDLILLDADMPGMSGFDLCRLFKRDPVLMDVPVIFTTAHPSVAFQVLAFDCGAADFVAKPVVPDHLRSRVRAHLLDTWQQIDDPEAFR
jgi:two-component system, cell cycle response regulator